MLEQLLGEIVGTRLSEALSQFRLAPQIKPHELNEAKDRLAALDTTPTLDLISLVDLRAPHARIQVHVHLLSALLQLDPNKLSLDYLFVEEPAVLSKLTHVSQILRAPV